MDPMMKLMVETILSHTQITVRKLMQEFDLNRNQLAYRIKKINDFFALEKLPLLKQEGNYLSLTFTEMQKKQFTELCRYTIHLPSKERQTYLLLLIMLYEQQTLNDFSKLLGSSRNTILADIKALNQYLQDWQLTIQYVRGAGYFLVGEEITVRKLWLHLIKDEVEKDFSLTIFHTIIKTDQHLLQDVYQKIEQLEQSWHLSFSEVKILHLSLIIYLSIVRAERKLFVAAKDIAKYSDLLKSDVYQAVTELFGHFFEEPYQQEVKFITMHILSINVVKQASFKKSLPLLQAIQKSIDYFEKYSITFFEDKTELARVLYQHIVPASYRIRFGVMEDSQLDQSIRREYQEFYSIIKKSIAPIEQELLIEFKETELSYLLILFLSFLKEEELQEPKRKTAVVVCMYGVSVSRLLLESLKELLPELQFKCYLSLREFYDTMPQVDLVFTTVAIDTELPTFFIKHFLTKNEKTMLKQKVQHLIFGHQSELPHSPTVNLDKLLSIIEKYAFVQDKTHLKQELATVFISNKTALKANVSELPEKPLQQLLTKQTIQIYNGRLSFDEAVRLCAKPLLDNGSIEPSYVNAIIRNYHPDYPYFVIAPEVAIPHAGPEDGVNKLALSLLRVSTPIPFSEELAVRLLVMVAPKDKKTHLHAVMTLYNLVNQAAFREHLFAADYEQTIYELFCEQLAQG